jgi:hypothetical protein
MPMASSQLLVGGGSQIEALKRLAFLPVPKGSPTVEKRTVARLLRACRQ